MPPQPRTNDKEIPLDTNIVDESMNVSQQVINIDNESNESSDEHESFDVDNNTEYAGYKLLQQDDAINSVHANEDDDEGSDDDGGSDSGDDVISSNVMTRYHIDINYDDLVVPGIDEEENFDNSIYDAQPDLCEENITDESANVTLKNMTQEHAEQVKTAMAGFTLPPVNIPEWAKNITEDDWKKSFIESVTKTT